MKQQKAYGNESISSLKGADRVRLRPAVIFGSDGLEGCEHAVFEILSNAIDEAREGYGRQILVTRYEDHSIEVEDFGRGCPVDWNEKEGKYNWELVFCELYAGGKYQNNTGGDYEFSLGLNGLGSCATQYSSEYFDAIIRRDGFKYTLHFEKGELVGKMKKEPTDRKATGSIFRWKPDLAVFTDIDIPKEYFEDTLKRQAVVNAGVTFTFRDQENGKFVKTDYCYPNGILDYVLIVIFHWGLAGAAIATSAGQIVGGLIPVIYFMRKNDSLLQFKKFHMHMDVIGKVCINGSSEMVTNLSSSIVNILYNFQLMKLAGEDGIAAYGVILYINIIFMAIFMGYSIGSAPIVSYHYGAGNHTELKNLFRKSLTFLMISGVMLLAASEVLARPLSAIFVNYDTGLLELTVHGFRIYSLAFLIMGINVWGSSFFTALNNGLVSAVISFLRTLVFQIVVISVLPLWFGVDGIWFSVVAAEGMALFVTLGFLFTNRRKYHY